MGTGETMRNNKLLDYKGCCAFSMSHFECYAQWRVDCDGEDYIRVRVYFDGSGDEIQTRKFPTTMTLGEIKSGTAVFILKELQKMQTKVLDFWQRLVKP
jgi:hypothetical protein